MDRKEGALFKEAIKFYENKQYKRGLKNCEQILKKYPEHGETLALKGLFILHLGKREEGFETCKAGLKLSIQSHVSWHILGLMHRNDKNYEEAIKCYKSSLRIESDNFQILRDLALLQLQCRQLEGVVDTRKKILLQRPTAPFNWISIVIAYHMSGNLKQALETLDCYLELFFNIADPSQEHLYYKVSIMSEMGSFKEAMTFMEQEIKNKASRRYNENYAEIALGAKEFDTCEVHVRKLLQINPDNRKYLSWLVKCYRGSDKDVDELYAEIHQNSLLSAVEFLGYLSDDEFSIRAPELITELLTKGSPALFSLFKPYITDDQSTRRQIIWTAITSHLQNEETKTAALAFATNYQSAIGNNEEALKYVDQLISLEPNQKDHVLLKARLLKRSQKSEEAVSILKAEQEYFLKDKFSASKSAKYFLRYGSISAAQNIIASFIQKPTMPDKIGDLHEMQAVWYLIEMADRLFADGKSIHAACFYRKIELIFEEFIDDQLDFHGFSIRKMAFVDYIKFLRFLDTDLRNSEFLKRSLIGQAKVLLAASNQSQSDVIEMLSNLKINEETPGFVDDIVELQTQMTELISKPKSVDESLKKICSNLLKYHFADKDVLQVCLEIALKMNAKLMAQNIYGKLAVLGESCYGKHMAAINADRSSPLWEGIAQLQ